MDKNNRKVRLCVEKGESESCFFGGNGEKVRVYDQMGKKLIGES